MRAARLALCAALLLSISACTEPKSPGVGEKVAQRTMALGGPVTLDGVVLVSATCTVGAVDSSGSCILPLARGTETQLDVLRDVEDEVMLQVHSSSTDLSTVASWQVRVTHINGSRTGPAHVVPGSSQMNPDASSDIRLKVATSLLDQGDAKVVRNLACAPPCQEIVTKPDQIDVVDLMALDSWGGTLATYTFSTIDRRGLKTEIKISNCQFDECDGHYGSTYSSNCTCSYCSKWCGTKSGGVSYSGTCC